jgi:hypothetical protein
VTKKTSPTRPKRSTAASEKLSAKQELFWQAYVGKAAGNATQAAKLAGYTGTDNVLSSVAWENLRNPIIRAHIDGFLADHAMTAQEVISELTAVAKTSAEDDPRAVKNKVSALALLAKYHGLLVERVDHTTQGQPLTFAALAQLATNDDSSGTGKNNR